MSVLRAGKVKAPPKNIHGKKFEAAIDEVFRALLLTHRCHWRRILDSAAAGNIISSTEGDFELLVPGEKARPFGFVVECKASTEYTSLGHCFRSLVKVGQLANMRLRIRGGMYGVYLFHSVENDEVEIWSAAPIIEAHPLKRQKFYCQPAVVVSKDNFHIYAKQWVQDPLAFLNKLIRSETVPVGVQHE